MFDSEEDIVINYLLEKYNYYNNLEKPLVSIKKCLNFENKGAKASRVEVASSFNVIQLSLSEILIPNKNHYNQISPREPKSVSGNKIIGIVQLKDDNYYLIDGYHRLKWCKLNNQILGSFIVLF